MYYTDAVGLVCVQFICADYNVTYPRIKFIRSLEQAVEDHDLIINKYKFSCNHSLCHLYHSATRPYDISYKSFTLLLQDTFNCLHYRRESFHWDDHEMNVPIKVLFCMNRPMGCCAVSTDLLYHLYITYILHQTIHLFYEEPIYINSAYPANVRRG